MIDIKRSSRELILLVCQQVLLMSLSWQTVSVARGECAHQQNLPDRKHKLPTSTYSFFSSGKRKFRVLLRNRISGGDGSLINLHRKSGIEENQIVICIGSTNCKLKAVHFFPHQYQHIPLKTKTFGTIEVCFCCISLLDFKD